MSKFFFRLPLLKNLHFSLKLNFFNLWVISISEVNIKITIYNLFWQFSQNNLKVYHLCKKYAKKGEYCIFYKGCGGLILHSQQIETILSTFSEAAGNLSANLLKLSQMYFFLEISWDAWNRFSVKLLLTLCRWEEKGGGCAGMGEYNPH